MNDLLDWITGLLDAREAELGAVLQTLWEGYGKIFRVHLRGSPVKSVIVKQVRPPPGLGDSLSHRRKLRSYEVESCWYQTFAARCSPSCRVARCFGQRVMDQEREIVLEDLDDSGFSHRLRRPSEAQILLGLEWLAEFHALFLNQEAPGLWPTGSYWHLQTRPDEWASMRPGPLREAAPRLHARLEQARHQTLVHGDAKLANFCLNPTQPALAAVDFQYVGRGVGMRDVAYYLGSALDEADLHRGADGLLERYFQRLDAALASTLDLATRKDLQEEWRNLYPVAWADFERFMQGWSPGYGRAQGYTEAMVARALEGLDE